MKRLIILLTAVCMLAGCGGSDSGTAADGSSVPAESAAAAEDNNNSNVDFRHGEYDYEKYPTGYYRIPADTQLYDREGKEAVKSGAERLSRGTWSSSGLQVTLPVENGENELGEKKYRYTDYYIKDEAAMIPASVEEARETVVNYALEMSRKPNQTYTLSGEYVGEDETRSDCSGMTELAYLQIGLYLEHYTVSQANNGGTAVFDNMEYVREDQGNEVYKVKDESLSVDYSKLEKGDLLFFLCPINSASDNELFTDNGIGHVAMYIGDGQMVHFTSAYGDTNHPCRTEDLAAYESSTLKVRKAVRYII